LEAKWPDPKGLIPKSERMTPHPQSPDPSPIMWDFQPKRPLSSYRHHFESEVERARAALVEAEAELARFNAVVAAEEADWSHGEEGSPDE
jgi:hypothetical protein